MKISGVVSQIIREKDRPKENASQMHNTVCAQSAAVIAGFCCMFGSGVFHFPF